MASEREIERYGPGRAQIKNEAGRIFDVTCSYRVTAGVGDSVAGKSLAVRLARRLFTRTKPLALRPATRHSNSPMVEQAASSST
jgi:hypothetical protein